MLMLDSALIAKTSKTHYNKKMNKQPDYLLVVEDIPNILELIVTTLKFKGGYRVVTANNGVEALDAIRQERPALVITDILMPKMDGFNLVHRLRLNPETRDIPVVFLSATYIAPEDKSFAALIGATRFLEKPIDIDMFMKTISELLVEKSSAASEPLKELEFYEGYRKRLKTKFDQKVKQIVRLERLLPTIKTDQEKNAIANSLLVSVNEREEIQFQLDQVDERISAIKKLG
jgi:CheY-like chemotaxis protein